MRLLIPCAIISYDALTDFIGHISKRDRHKYQDNEVEKERHKLVFRIQSNIYDGALLQRLTAKSFIVDIRPGSKYPSDERNKLFSFSIKATLKATTLGICMCSTELLLWKNPKVWLVTPCFYVNETPPLTFSYEHSNYFWTSYFTKQFRTTDCKWFFKLNCKWFA